MRNRRTAALAALALLGVTAGPVWALYIESHEEHVGPGRPVPLVSELTSLGTALNHSSRLYWRHDHWFGFGACCDTFQTAHASDGPALAAALRAFATAPATITRRVVLVPGGPGTVPMLDGKRRVACEWRCHAVAYIPGVDGKMSAASRTTLTAWLIVYVPDRLAPLAPAPAEQLLAWIADLDHPRQAVRDAAHRHLLEQGVAARPALRQALPEARSAEQRSRLQRLLRQTDGIYLEEFEAPAGLPVFSLDELRADSTLLKAAEPILGPELKAASGSEALRRRIDEFCRARH